MENLDTKYETGVWYGWNGGECPVHPETVVEVRLCDPAEEFGDMTDMADDWYWVLRGSSGIVSFRIVTPYVEPAPKLECWVYTDQNGKIMGETRIDLEQTAMSMARHYGGRAVRMVEADE